MTLLNEITTLSDVASTEYFSSLKWLDNKSQEHCSIFSLPKKRTKKG